LFTGFIASLLSAGMFRRVPVTAKDFANEADLPASARRFFFISMLFSLLPLIIYFLWLLRWANINTALFEFLTDPLESLENPLALQEGTAFLSLVALVLNITSYNRIVEYKHSFYIWNMRMVLVCSASFLISLWLIVHGVHYNLP
jgi:hypothetical protein